MIRIFSKDVGMEFDIQKCAMLIMKRKGKRNNEGNITTKLGKHQNTWWKRKLQVNENIRIGCHKTNRNERKSKKIVPQKNKKTSQPNSAAEISSKG